jgi:hypothetical protein
MFREAMRGGDHETIFASADYKAAAIADQDVADASLGSRQLLCSLKCQAIRKCSRVAATVALNSLLQRGDLRQVHLFWLQQRFIWQAQSAGPFRH